MKSNLIKILSLTGLLLSSTPLLRSSYAQVVIVPGSTSSGGSGTVTSVSGTANQIDVATGTTTPVLSLSSTLIAPGTITSTTSITSGTSITAATTSFINFTGRSQIQSGADGNIDLLNAAGSSFGLIRLGGTSSSFPAIKRSSALIAFRLADDSADTGITASTGAFSSTLTAVTSATITNTSVGATSTDGLILTNTTSATSGNQKWSPAIDLIGQGFGTSGSASQQVNYKIETKPVQGTTATGILQFTYNGGGFGTPQPVFLLGGTTSVDQSFVYLVNNTSGITTSDGLRLGEDGANAVVWNMENGYLSLGSNGIDRWHVDSSGNFVAATDASFDIGASGATRPRNGFFSGTITTAGATFTGAINAGSQAATFGTVNINYRNAVSINSSSELFNAGGSTALADNTATTFATITVTNAANAGSFRIRLTGTLGAGGAVGAGEATETIEYLVSVARTSGVATVVTVGTGYGTISSSVAGGATITVTLTAGAVSGGNSSTQTIPLQVTIAHGSGSSTNHTCSWSAELLLSSPSSSGGITIG